MHNAVVRRSASAAESLNGSFARVLSQQDIIWDLPSDLPRRHTLRRLQIVEFAVSRLHVLYIVAALAFRVRSAEDVSRAICCLTMG